MKQPQYRGVNELRRMFLEFFESKGHLVMKSFSLVPHNDNSLLLINSGMAPLKPYFTGQEIPPRRRVTTCQKCIRTGDIENIGKTARHGTFFEMLGNFSFGDYFKTEAIHWSWEFLTEVVGLDPDRLYPSIYQDDDEAFDIWNKEIGIAPERIFRFGKEDNFWEHGSGPCGPCSEVYYDRGEKYGCGKPGCTVGCECDRYMEIWNDVFSQFNNDGHGNYSDLAQKNIDTGMGLERLACVVQDVDSMFDIDTMKALRDHVCAMSGKHYGIDHETDVSLRVVTDHIRSVTFMISDGIMPSNSGRGYVLRRLIRRAARHGRLLGIEGTFLAKLSEEAMTALALVYPIQNLITAIGVGIGIGINAGIAYYLGAKKQTTANQIATQGIALSVLHGILLTVLCTAGLWKFLKGFSADLEVNLMAITYGNRVLLFSVVITLGITFEKIFQSVGKMKVSMFSMICGCLINILLDPLMIFGIGPFPAMGIAGAAYATGIGQTATLLIYLIFYFADPIPVKIQLKYLKPEKQVISRIYAVGIPATLNMALPSLLISSLNGILSGFSEKYVLVLGVYYKLQTFIYLSANGIIQGIRPLIGYNYGAGEKKRVEKIFRTALGLVLGVMAAGMLISWLIPGKLIGLFTVNEETIRIGITALHIISFGFIVSGVSVTCSGALEGLGKGTPSFCIALLRYVIVIIPAAFLFGKILGANGVWLAFPVAEALTAVFAIILYQR